MYVSDSASLINLYRTYGNIVISILRSEVKKDKLKLPEGVVRELTKGKDRLARFIGKYEQMLKITIKSEFRLKDELARIEQSYGEEINIGKQKLKGFWHSPSGRKSADGQVIAVAKVKGAVVVSDDNAIKAVCLLENIVCIGWTEYARQIGIVQQLDLNF